MAKRTFVMLAHHYDPAKHHIAAWMVSEKRDGIRAVWDGGVSRGMFKKTIPWANNDKDERYIKPPISTGLWTRLGNVIHAPDWFLDRLPTGIVLDGEMDGGRGRHQFVTSVTSCIVPDERWREIRYMVFDSPKRSTWLANGEIKETHFKKRLTDCEKWAAGHQQPVAMPDQTHDYDRMYRWLYNYRYQNECIGLIEQEQLPTSTQAAVDRFNERFAEVDAGGGEGLVLRSPYSVWTPERSYSLLKYKPEKDDEAKVTGYMWGRKTELGSKLLGLMGALVLDYKGKRLELSGFTNDERQMSFHPFPDGRTADMLCDKQIRDPDLFNGESIDRDWYNPRFPIGCTITFKYRELTDAGLPKEASYHRKRVPL